MTFVSGCNKSKRLPYFTRRGNALKCFCIHPSFSHTRQRWGSRPCTASSFVLTPSSSNCFSLTKRIETMICSRTFSPAAIRLRWTTYGPPLFFYLHPELIGHINAHVFFLFLLRRLLLLKNTTCMPVSCSIFLFLLLGCVVSGILKSAGRRVGCVEDKECGPYQFTDGVGMMSQELSR